MWRDPEPVKKWQIPKNYTTHIVKSISQSLGKSGWKNTRVINGDAVNKAIEMKQKGDLILLIFGSHQLVKGLINHNLVDDSVILVQPMFTRRGEKLFEGLIKKIILELLSRKNFSSGVVVLHYKLKT